MGRNTVEVMATTRELGAVTGCSPYIPYEDAEMIVRTRYQRVVADDPAVAHNVFPSTGVDLRGGTRLGNYVQYGHVTRLSGYLRWPLVELDGSTATCV